MLRSNATPANITINSSPSFLSFHYCMESKSAFFLSLAFVITNMSLLLPLSLAVLHLGVQRWRRSLTTTSHSDFFTYHFVAMELVFVSGFVVYLCGWYLEREELLRVSNYPTYAFYPGQMLIHILTCMERYLAVIHPVTYLGLRQSGGVRTRNISISCVWLLYCGWMGVEALYYPNVPYAPILCFLVLSLAVLSFCCLSVLRALIRPGPGEAVGRDVRGDQAKRRAFHTITAITLVLWLFFLGKCVCLALGGLLSYAECALLAFGSWFTLPSSLVLPLLFLHRAGMLVCCH